MLAGLVVFWLPELSWLLRSWDANSSQAGRSHCLYGRAAIDKISCITRRKCGRASWCQHRLSNGHNLDGVRKCLVQNRHHNIVVDPIEGTGNSRTMMRSVDWLWPRCRWLHESRRRCQMRSFARLMNSWCHFSRPSILAFWLNWWARRRCCMT